MIKRGFGELMTSNKERYSNAFREKIRSNWGTDFMEPLLKTIQETCDAAFNVIEFRLEPNEEPEVKPTLSGGE
jgi:hypothetical protein